ncbi:MAG: hypothetical protein NUW37_15585 [Planctomycetes bacterium]|nr:hypothetical protein [Planctomycetota bacterium]
MAKSEIKFISFILLLLCIFYSLIATPEWIDSVPDERLRISSDLQDDNRVSKAPTLFIENSCPPILVTGSGSLILAGKNDCVIWYLPEISSDSGLVQRDLTHSYLDEETYFLLVRPLILSNVLFEKYSSYVMTVAKYHYNDDDVRLEGATNELFHTQELLAREYVNSERNETNSIGEEIELTIAFPAIDQEKVAESIRVTEISNDADFVHRGMIGLIKKYGDPSRAFIDFAKIVVGYYLHYFGIPWEDIDTFSKLYARFELGEIDLTRDIVEDALPGTLNEVQKNGFVGFLIDVSEEDWFSRRSALAIESSQKNSFSARDR